jgi:hypothetical protein
MVTRIMIHVRKAPSSNSVVALYVMLNINQGPKSSVHRAGLISPPVTPVLLVYEKYPLGLVKFHF